MSRQPAPPVVGKKKTGETVLVIQCPGQAQQTGFGMTPQIQPIPGVAPVSLDRKNALSLLGVAIMGNNARAELIQIQCYVSAIVSPKKTDYINKDRLTRDSA